VTLSAGVTSLTFGTSGNPKAKPDSPSDIAGITLNPIPAGSSVIFQYAGVVAASAAGTNITSTANGTAVVRRWWSYTTVFRSVPAAHTEPCSRIMTLHYLLANDVVLMIMTLPRLTA